MNSDADYYMHRARQEATFARTAATPTAAAAHQALAIRYSAKALLLRADEDLSPVPAFPQLREAAEKRTSEVVSSPALTQAS